MIAEAFIEGSTNEGLDKPYVVYLRNQKRPFAFAGIWEKWADPESGEITNSFAIITTVSNSLLQMIPHHRSPVILSQSHERRWLKAEHLNEITGMLEPFPSDEMNAYPIDKRIKNPRVNDRQLMDPIGERLLPETEEVVKTSLQLQGMSFGRGDSK